MQVPFIDFAGTEWVGEDRRLTPVAQLFMNTLMAQLNANIGPEALVPPALSSETTTKWPSGQLSVVAANPNAIKGTLVFDTYALNGGAVGPPRVPNGQLAILLQDGTFHYIPNL